MTQKTDVTCDCCQYVDPVGGVEKYPLTVGKTVMLCEICRCTYIGNTLTPSGYVQDKLQVSIAWIGNRLREDVRNAGLRVVDEIEEDGE